MTTAALRAYFYTLEGEMPPPDAPDEWFLPRADPTIRTEAAVAAFHRETRRLLTELGSSLTEDEIQALFYERAKAAFGTDKAAIRDYFRMLYLLIFQRPSGPRWGQFVILIGRQAFIDRLKNRLADPVAL